MDSFVKPPRSKEKLLEEFLELIERGHVNETLEFMKNLTCAELADLHRALQISTQYK